jgi:hypothetical protein
MKWVKECTSDRMVTDFQALEFVIMGTQIELQCNRCNGLIGWWHHLDRRTISFRRAWSNEERLAMR